MKNKTLFLISMFIASTAVAAPDGALNGYQLAALFSEATMSGLSNGTPGATFEQTYKEIKLGHTKGKLKGKWTENGNTSTYKAKWSIKNDQWCEKWKGGNACWDVVQIGGNEYQFYKDSEPLSVTWFIDSPQTRPVRLSTAELEEKFARPYVEKGDWKHSNGDKGTYETHYCGLDKTSYGKSSSNNAFTPRTYSVKNDDTFCRKNSDGTRCYKAYRTGEVTTHYVRTDGKITVNGTLQPDVVSEQCGT